MSASSVDDGAGSRDLVPVNIGFAPTNGRQALVNEIRLGWPASSLRAGGRYHRGLDHEGFMRQALALARLAGTRHEVPVGAVLVREGVILAQAHNAPIATGDPTAHAEMQVLREGAQALGNYRLADTTLYVTLEPCPMCAGAMVNARVGRLVFACRDLRFGGVRSKFRIADSEVLNHQVEVIEGVLAAECMELLKQFFERRR